MRFWKIISILCDPYKRYYVHYAGLLRGIDCIPACDAGLLTRDSRSAAEFAGAPGVAAGVAGHPAAPGGGQMYPGMPGAAAGPGHMPRHQLTMQQARPTPHDPGLHPGR